MPDMHCYMGNRTPEAIRTSTNNTAHSLPMEDTSTLPDYQL